jgi:hypothetical protein
MESCRGQRFLVKAPADEAKVGMKECWKGTISKSRVATAATLQAIAPPYQRWLRSMP